jgi:RNA polymerase sigma-70 factor (sigma-E family)
VSITETAPVMTVDDGFADFVAARGPALQRTAYFLTSDWTLAEDLLQAALTRVYPRWSRVANDEPEAYVRRVLVNTWSSWWRRKWRGEVPTDAPPERPGDEPYAAVDRSAALDAALSRLPRRQRAVVVLRFQADLTEAEVARVMDISVGTVKSQTAKALARMRGDAALTGYGLAADDATEGTGGTPPGTSKGIER